MKKVTFYFLLAAMALTHAGCFDTDDFSDVRVGEVSPSFGFPVMSSSLTLGDLLTGFDTAQFVLDTVANTIKMVFLHDGEYNLNLEEFRLPDKEFNIDFIVAPVVSSIYNEAYTTIDFDSEISEALLSGGELEVAFTRDFSYDCEVVLTLISLTQMGTGDTIRITPNWTMNPLSSVSRQSLANTRLGLREDMGGGVYEYNRFRYAVSFSTESNTNLEINNLGIQIRFSNVEFSKMVGHFDYTFSTPLESVAITAFDSVFGAKVLMTDPTLTFNVSSSFGTPAAIDVEMEFVNAEGTTMRVENTASADQNTLLVKPQTNYIPAATPANPFVVKPLVLSADNSNIVDVYASAPNRGRFSSAFRIGQWSDSNWDKHSSYVLDTSNFDINTRIEVPLFGYIDSLVFKMPIDLSFPPIENVEMINDYTVTLRLKTDNGLPFRFGLQANFYNEQGEIIERMFDGMDSKIIIESPPIKPDGFPDSTKVTITDIVISKEKYQRISSASQAEYLLRIDTGGEQGTEVNIGPNYSLKIQMAVQLKATLNPDTMLGN